MIEIINVTKKYGDFTAVQNISFKVRRGEIYGLLGENGAGKTTILRMISSIIKPTNGDIKIDGHNPSDIKHKIGVATTKTQVYDSLTVKENLNLFISFYKINKNEKVKRIEELLEQLELKKFYNKKCSELSHGNRQKLILARALIGNPDILILDEIMNGLDVGAQQSVRNVINKFKDNNSAILFTSHNMSDIELLCDRIGVIHNGKMTYEAEINSLDTKSRKEDLEFLVKEGNLYEC